MSSCYAACGLSTTWPPSTPAMTVKRSKHVKKRNAAVARLPAGYVFFPPAGPLTYPQSYHLVDAGPMNEARKVKRKRAGNEEAVVTVPMDAVGNSARDTMGRISVSHFGPYSFIHGDTHGGEVGSLVGELLPLPSFGSNVILLISGSASAAAVAGRLPLRFPAGRSNYMVMTRCRAYIRRGRWVWASGKLAG
ncbi:hypothetical protein C8R45DRAFT_1217713 [Mycena sanguinolenta]|nr:hypothetical protein C8R45DRAFT_1217713 [Mycena sanguinolenta]